MQPPTERVAESGPSQDERLALLLDQVIDAIAKGQPVDHARLLAEHPDLAGPLAALLHFDGTATDPTPLPHPSLPTQIGPYTIERELGSGGFGIVYLARDCDLNRRVALKVLHPGRLHHPEVLQRFHREAAITAQLRHPGIVQLFDYSRQGPPYYLVTEFIDGSEPRVWCQQALRPVGEVVELVARIADVIEYAHSQGVCHRDLKPANILVDQAGMPHVLDFGLAHHADAVLSLTPTSEGRILGSLPYMAPEQAAGQSHAADARSDIYSLGVILYELLTGRPPFDGPLHTLPARVMEEQPPPPRGIAPEIPPDVEAVCLKALAKRPESRYPTATAMAQDLRATLRGEAVEARRFTWVTYLYRLLGHRHRETLDRGWTLLLVLLGLVILTGCILTDVWNACLRSPFSLLAILATKGCQIVVMVVLAARLRPAKQSQLTSAERQIWTLMPAYYGGFLSLLIVNWRLDVDIPLAPVLAVLSGMGFASLGATIWGWFYVWGLAFFALAVVVVFFPSVAMSFLGLGWFACLALGGLHLRYTR